MHFICLLEAITPDGSQIHATNTLHLALRFDREIMNQGQTPPPPG